MVKYDFYIYIYIYICIYIYIYTTDVFFEKYIEIKYFFFITFLLKMKFQ